TAYEMATDWSSDVCSSDLAGRDAQLGGEPRAGDDERVVARRLERVREAGEQTTPVVADAGRLAVHRTPGAHDAGTVRGADALVPQAYAEDGDRRPEIGRAHV